MSARPWRIAWIVGVPLSVASALIAELAGTSGSAATLIGFAVIAAFVLAATESDIRERRRQTPPRH